jgi:hypothetical protein
MDPTSALLLTVGTFALIGSWIVLMIESWKDDYAWGLCTLLLPPLSYLYGLFRLDRAAESLALAIAGTAMVYLAIG